MAAAKSLVVMHYCLSLAFALMFDGHRGIVYLLRLYSSEINGVDNERVD